MPTDFRAISLLRPALWCPILQVSVDLAALTFIIISPPHQAATLFKPHFPTVRRMPQTKSQHESGSHLVCSPSLENHSPVRSTAQCLRIVVDMFLPNFTAIEK